MTDEDVGYLYILSNQAMPGIYKIGVTSRDDLSKRIDELYVGQTSVPLPFDVEFACKVKDYKQVEKIIHNTFLDYRINSSREFFDVNPERIIPLLKHLQCEDTTINIAKRLNETTPEIDKESSIRYKKKRPRFNFIEMGINIGNMIVFDNENSSVEAEIISENTVKFNNEEYTLTKLTSKLLGLSYSIAPLPCWKYKDKTLREYYNETYSQIE
jgi:hypothetical protein